MKDIFMINWFDRIRFNRERMVDSENPNMVVYEVYIKVSKEDAEKGNDTEYDEMLRELGYEFMDRDHYFDKKGEPWGDESDPVWDKWFKFINSAAK